MPCRMGKTVISGHIVREKAPHTLIVIAPLKISVENLFDRLCCFLPSYECLKADSDVDGVLDKSIIQMFLNKEVNKVIYTTFKSATEVLSTLTIDYKSTFILVDEAHNATIDLIEFINKFANGLIMSATLPEEILEMVKINKIYRIPFSRGIKEGYIVDYTLWVPHLKKDAEGTSVDIDIPEEFSIYHELDEKNRFHIEGTSTICVWYGLLL